VPEGNSSEVSLSPVDVIDFMIDCALNNIQVFVMLLEQIRFADVHDPHQSLNDAIRNKSTFLSRIRFVCSHLAQLPIDSIFDS